MAITNYPAVITSVDRIKRQLNWLRHARYLWLGLMCYGAIAGTVYVYLHRPAVFASGMSLVLPGSGSSSSFSI